MHIGFIVTSPYQLFHFKRIHEHFPSSSVYLEVREQELGITEDLVLQHLPGANVVWLNSRDLRKIDGKCEALVCQTPVPLMQFFSKSLVVAQQYSLAKERYQYGVWRAQANLNLMYGGYSRSCVTGFSTAVAVGNPLLDKAYSGGGASNSARSTSSRLRVLYMPTYGDLSHKESTLRALITQDVSLTIKLHHAEADSFSIAKEHSIPIVGSDADPIDTILEHDVVVSDFSGAIFDALAVRRPVIVIGKLNEQSRDVHRLSKEDRSRSEIGELVGRWTTDCPFEEAFELAQSKLANEAGFQRFLGKYFVNLGHAGKACADEIAKLIDHGEPYSFSVRQVRESNRRYILENRELKAKLKTSAANGKVPFKLPHPNVWSPRVGTLKAIRWILMTTPGGDHVLGGLRRLRSKVSQHVDNQHCQIPHNGLSLPLVPRLRRQAMLGIVEEVFARHDVEYRVKSVETNVYCAVRDSKLDKVSSALNELGRQSGLGQVHVWLGRGTRYDTVCPAESISLSNVTESDSMIVGVPYQEELYYLGRRGGVEILILERRDARLVARRWRAEKVDWTLDFDNEVSAVTSASGTSSGGVSRNGHIGKTHALENEPIDIVYTWVNSADPEWQAARKAWASKQSIELESAGNDERYIDRDELRYSLRSVWLYAPFVRNIFIVTAGHRPKWLSSEQEGVRVISHDQIFVDPSNLPTFNSHAIEACLHRIPGLSENFIYFNDDVFLARESTIDTFYSKAGLIKSRFSPSSFTAVTQPDISAIPTDWASYNAVRLIAREFDLQFDRKMKHVPMPMKVSLLQEIEDRYPELIAKTRAAHFRSRTDVSVPSMLAHYYGIATGRAIETENKPGEYVYADTGRSDFESRLRAITRNKPMFFCLNVTRHVDIELAAQAALLQDFLKRRYPVASPFEIAEGRDEFVYCKSRTF